MQISWWILLVFAPYVCACMQARRLSTAHVQVNSNMSKTKSKGGKETARKKKGKERPPPLASKSSQRLQYPVICCSKFIYKNKETNVALL